MKILNMLAAFFAAAALLLPAQAFAQADTINVNNAPVSTTNPLPTSPSPLELPSVNGSATISVGGSFQTVLAQNSSRKGCFIQNPITATEPLYVYVYSGTSGTPSLAGAIGLGAGAPFYCSVGASGVITDQIAVEAATTGHAFVEFSQ
jgi:hypothetical protein